MSDHAMTQALAEKLDAIAASQGIYGAEQLAQASGLSLERVQLVLDAKRWPCPNDLRCLARAVGRRPEQLIPNPNEL